MLSTSVVDEIRRMLKEGRLSQRKIASQIGVSRGTVNAIATNKCDDMARRRAENQHGFTPPSGPPGRCPGCGAKVRMPCLVCHIRSVYGRKGQQ